MCQTVFIVLYLTLYYIFQPIALDETSPVPTIETAVDQTLEEDVNESFDTEPLDPILEPRVTRTGRITRPPARYIQNAQLDDTSLLVSFPLKFIKLTDLAITPSPHLAKSSSLIVHSAYWYPVASNRHILVETDLQVTLVDDSYVLLFPYGKFAKYFDMPNGIILDASNEGKLAVPFLNFSDHSFEIQPGDAIAQLVYVKTCFPVLVEQPRVHVPTVDDDLISL